LAALALLLAVAIPALGGSEPSSVQTATGCINSLHKLIKVALGDTPSSPCTSGQTQVTLAGGDVTSVVAGSGLSGGGTEGDVTLNTTIHVVQGATVPVPNGQAKFAILVGCGTETEDAFAGSWRWDVPASGESVMLAGPSFRNDGTIGAWRFDVQNNSGADKMFTGFVTCLKK